MRKYFILLSLVFVLFTVVGCTTESVDLATNEEYDSAQETIYNIMFAENLDEPVASSYLNHTNFINDYAPRAIPLVLIEALKEAEFTSSELTVLMAKISKINSTNYYSNAEEKFYFDILIALSILDYDGEKIVNFISGFLDNSTSVTIEFLENHELYTTNESYQDAVREYETQMTDSIAELKYDEIDKEQLILVIDLFYNDTIDYITGAYNAYTSLDYLIKKSYDDAKTILETNIILFDETLGKLTQDDIFTILSFFSGVSGIYDETYLESSEELELDAEFLKTIIDAYGVAIKVLVEDDVFDLFYYSVYTGHDDYVENANMNLNLVAARVCDAVFADGLIDRTFMGTVYDMLSEASESPYFTEYYGELVSRRVFIESYDSLVEIVDSFIGIELDNDYTVEEYASVEDYL